MVYTPHTELHASIVVSKKVSARAVDRNKIRRRMYDIVRRYRADVGVRGVFIFLVKPAIRGIAYADLKTEMCTCLKNTQR